MKFTKLITASFVALGMFSCTKEITDLGGQQMKNGDAMISFNLGGGATTYATGSSEKEMKTLNVFLEYLNASGTTAFKQIPASDVTIAPDGSSANIKHVLNAGTFSEGNANLYVVANATAFASAPADATALKAMLESKAIAKLVGGSFVIEGGMTATSAVAIEIKTGAVSGPSGNAVALKRLASRVYVEAVTGSIANYTVDFSNVQGNAGLFTYESTVAAAKNPDTYTITEKNFTDQYGKKEAVGYLYPSKNKDVTIKVSKAGLTPIETVFRPASNKNYKLSINPKMEGGVTASFSVSITEYDADETLPDFDFESTAIATKAFVENIKLGPIAIKEFDLLGSSVTIKTIYNGQKNSPKIDLSALASIDVKNPAASFGFKSIKNVTVRAPQAKTKAADLSNYINVSKSSEKELTVTYVPNTTGNDITVKVEVEGIVNDGASDLLVKSSFDIVLPTIPQNELKAMADATVTMGGNDWIQFTTDGSLQSDYANALAISVAGGINEAAIKAHPEYFNRGIGKRVCPIGYKVPTEDDYFNIWGQRRGSLGPGADGKWLPTVGSKMDFVSGVKGEFLSLDGALAIYTMKKDAATMWLLGNINYATSTVSDGRMGEPVRTDFVYRVSSWNNGIAISAVGPADPAAHMRCIVNKDYKGVN